MLALSPPCFSSIGWRLQDQMSYEQHNWAGADLMADYNDGEPCTPESVLRFSSSLLDAELDYPIHSGGTGDNLFTVKKLSHNANERDRRKKLNNLYSTLRSLLPGTDQTKKLSIPVTISRVLKYIPELQKQAKRLLRAKEEILSQISLQGDLTHTTTKRGEATSRSSYPAVSTSQVDDKEIVVQICTLNLERNPLSKVLVNLEEEGLQLMNASVFAPARDRVFYNLHLQVKETLKMECSMLSEKLLYFCGNKEELFP